MCQIVDFSRNTSVVNGHQNHNLTQNSEVNGAIEGCISMSNIPSDELKLFKSILKRQCADICDIVLPFTPSDDVVKETEKETCAICLLEFDDVFHDMLSGASSTINQVPDTVAVTLPCKHPYHLDCVNQIYENNARKFLDCALCKKVFGGVQTGLQPSGGSMQVDTIDMPCAGYEGYQTYQVTYSIPRGIQGPGHPNPGLPYHLSGFPRIGYIPKTPEGTRIVNMLRVAFDRRLIFTVGTSHTSGLTDQVVWGGIHHKTSPNGGAHGYPDSSHLANLKDELNNLNVFETDVTKSY